MNASPSALLRRFQSKAACAHTQPAAHRAWADLRPHLTEGQRQRLRLAWTHSAEGEGRAAFDRACALVRAEWAGT